MKNGWNEVARLGTAEDGYPHVLVDAHGWCLRLGRTRSDEKFYSNLPSLLQGLIEHVIRRHLRDCGTLNSAESMLTEVRVALDQAACFQSTLAAATHQQSPIRPLEPLKDLSPAANLLPPGEAAWLAQSPFKELHRTAERKVIAHLGSSPDGYGPPQQSTVGYRVTQHDRTIDSVYYFSVATAGFRSCPPRHI